MLHFPEQLAFALSGSHTPSTLINAPELFGEHCRSNMDLYTQNKQYLDTGLSIHSSGPNGSEHFDVMATFPTEGRGDNESGVIFVSFGIENLERLLQTGSSSAYSLSLKNSDEQSINTLRAALLPANTDISGDSTELPTVPNYSLPVNGTPWILQGSLNTMETSRAWNASLVQTIIGTFVLLIAGLTAWRSIEQEKISNSRTAIVLNSVESERRRIARDLHDQVLSDVTHAKRLLMELGPANGESEPINTDKLLSAQRSVDEFSNIIRTAINELYPHTLENLGLCKALESYMAGRSQIGLVLNFEFDAAVDTMLEPTQKLHTYRIVTELVNNSINHSECTEVKIKISHKSHAMITVYVADNGNGFDSTAARKPDSYGIDNIETRAMLLGALYKWTKDGTEGTCFELTISLIAHATA
ncbi:MAG: ATP-binding protein [Granulosicoccaceae bacterium]